MSSNDKESIPCPTCGVARRKDRTGRYVKRVNLARENRKALTIMSRDLDYLMRYSNVRPLEEEESTALRGYVKLLRELNRDNKEDDSSKSLAEIEALAAKDLTPK